MSGTSTAAARYSKGIDNNNIDAFLDLAPETSYCGMTRYGKGRFRWNKRLTSTEINDLVAAHYPQVGSVRALEPLERGASGRIKKLRIRGSKGMAVAAGDLHIRRLLGGLRSSLFVVHPIGSRSSPSAFEFRGAGFGHGVGMCQIGAIGMAEHGSSYNAILRHYYAGSRIKRLY
jgi:SpoIID/LytB domain protein